MFHEKYDNLKKNNNNYQLSFQLLSEIQLLLQI